MKPAYLIVLCVILTSTSCTMNLKKIYKDEVTFALKQSNSKPSKLLLENDIEHLPVPVQKYIKYTGAIGKEQVRNVSIKASGKIRSNANNGWMIFSSEQYNIFDKPLRAFYIKAKKMGVPANGLHLYKNETAIMVIKLLGLFKVVDAKGFEMNQGETVTIFNDMCFMAPASLIDKNIQWDTLDSLHVKAKYTNGSITISATLTFDEEGKLVDFISNDRFETSDGKIYKNVPWRTPVKEYGTFNGYRLPSKADVIYQHPDGEFCYLKFKLEDISYNLK
jgi:hypothetical protein